MQGTSFRFRQFTIHQDKAAMKVGTDGVLLGCWVNPHASKNILDIGTGTGLIAIMLAQKSEANIKGIEIDKDSFEQATGNANLSPWKERIQIEHVSLQDFAQSGSDTFDLIVSNPPYFGETMSAADDAKTKAKHTTTLSYSDLIRGVAHLLSEQGRFCVILPFQKSIDFREQAAKAGLYCCKSMRVITLEGKSEKRIMMEFGFEKKECQESELTMQNAEHHFTREYINFTADYYLGLK